MKETIIVFNFGGVTQRVRRRGRKILVPVVYPLRGSSKAKFPQEAIIRVWRRRCRSCSGTPVKLRPELGKGTCPHTAEVEEVRRRHLAWVPTGDEGDEVEEAG